jgi:hypothetical protein
VPLNSGAIFSVILSIEEPLFGSTGILNSGTIFSVKFSIEVPPLSSIGISFADRF